MPKKKQLKLILKLLLVKKRLKKSKKENALSSKISLCPKLISKRVMRLCKNFSTICKEMEVRFSRICSVRRNWTLLNTHISGIGENISNMMILKEKQTKNPMQTLLKPTKIG